MTATPPPTRWRIAVLGPTRLMDQQGSHPVFVDLPRQDLMVLTALAALAHGGGMVDADVIEEHAWRGAPSARALQSAIYRLRAVMGPDAIETRRRTVRLSSAVAVDLDEFVTAGVDGGGRQSALDLVRGVPFQTMDDHPAWRALRESWQQRVEAVRDASVDELMATGHLAEAVELLVEQLTGNPPVSGRWLRLVDALTALGRRAEALRAVDYASKALADAGLELDDALRQRERQLLAGTSGGLSTPVSPRGTAPDLPGAPSNAAHPTPPPPGASRAMMGRDQLVRQIVAAVTAPSPPTVIVRARPGLGARSVRQAAVSQLAAEGWRIVTLPQHTEGLGLADSLRLVCVLMGHATDHPAPDSFTVADAARRVGGRTLVVYGERTQRPADVWGAVVLAATMAGDALRVLGADANVVASGDESDCAVITVGPLDQEATAEIAGQRATEMLGMHQLALLTGGGPGYARDVGAALAADSPLFGVMLRIISRRIAALPPRAARLLTLASVVGGKIPVRIAARAFEWSIGEIEHEAATLEAHGFVLPRPDGAEIAMERWLSERVGDVLPQAARQDARDALTGVLGNDARAVWMRSRAVLSADPIDGWRTVLRDILDVAESEVEHDPEALIGLIDSALVALSTSPEMERTGRPRLLSRRAMAERLRGRVAESWADSAAAHRAALRIGDPELQNDLLREMNYPALVSVTDDGEPIRRLADSFAARPGLDPRLRVQVDALRAFHQYARGDRALAHSMADGLLEQARQYDDPEIARRVASILACDVLFDRSRVAEANYSIDAERAGGSLALAGRSMIYLLCSRVRCRQATFDDPLMDDLYFMCDGQHAGITEVRVATLQVTAAVIGADLKRAIELSRGALNRFDSPLRQASKKSAVVFALRPDWHNIPAHEMFGDPALYRLSAPTDVGLWQAAVACAAGDTASAAAFLGTLSEPVIDGKQSAMVISRLPLLSAVARAVGDRDLASHLLTANLGMCGMDLSMLPAAHLGPAESWLAVLADVAGDERAHQLHGAAAERLSALGARVLELA